MPSAAAAEFQLNASVSTRLDAAQMARIENQQCDYPVTFRDIYVTARNVVCMSKW
jgi:hypothetical protein